MHRETFVLGETETTLETGRIARQAHGAVMLRQGKTAILATVVANADEPAQGFWPLTVDYREKTAAAARIPGNFFRREARPGEHETLTSRLIDRSLRPLVADGFTGETQVAVTVYSAEKAADLAGLALIAAGAALHISPVPFSGPLAGVRIVRRDDRWRIPAGDPMAKKSTLDLVLAATPSGLVMLEGEGAMVPEALVIEACDHAQAALGPALEAMDRLRDAAGAEKWTVSPVEGSPLPEGVEATLSAALDHEDKTPRRTAIKAARAATDPSAHRAFDAALKRMARARILAGRRADGRAADAVRPIEAETGVLPANHGSAVFTRGDTQVLVSATLGGQRDSQDLERLYGMTRRRFLLHYNFPSFSVGETRRGRPGPGRREIGHGHLARRAMLAVLPGEDVYPYTVRVVSDVTESNGSSSMATICGATLAMLSAGVPLEAPVAGVAMGLICEGEHAAILTDILGDEDHLGDMDFKVAGTAEGITAIQLDNKLGSLPAALLGRALAQARAGRLHILEAMAPAIEAVQGRVPDHVPRHARVRINPKSIGRLIGPGGRNLQAIQSKTGARIDVNQDGTVLVMGKDQASTRAAVREVQGVSIELEKGGLYVGEVRNVKDFGVFVRIADHEGLVHVSELGGATPQTGEELLVRVLGADDRGRLKLSHKAAQDASALDAINA